MRRVRRFLLGAGLLAAVVVSATGCATSGGYRKVQPTPIDQALTEIPEEQLLDVGVEITEAVELTPKQMEKLGTSEDIRQCERYFIPFHLKNTLQMSSHWGEVQVVPPEEDSVDLKVTSEIAKSNGELLQYRVIATDATGRVWLDRKYAIVGRKEHYGGQTLVGSREAFQDLYNTVANDLSAFKANLTPEELEEIREVAKLRFAADMAPEAYGDYVAQSASGLTTVQRLPAENDPMMDRIELIREREDLFLDTLNTYYEGYYRNMWEAYENWRRYNLAEQVALRKVKQDAFFQTLAGALMVAAAVGLQASGVSGADIASGLLIAGGTGVIIGGIDVSKQAEIHAAAIRELGESFGAEARPIVIELEGKQYELTGTASEQFRTWRELLRQIYLEETGFGADAPSQGDSAPTIVGSAAPI